MLRGMAKRGKGNGREVIAEVKLIDRVLQIGTGAGLARFVPSYFEGGVKPMAIGGRDGAMDLTKGGGDELPPLAAEPLSPAGGGGVELPPFAARPILRLVLDREKSGEAAQGFLRSRCRVLEVSDPAHIMWRAALNGVAATGARGAVASLTFIANAFRGPWKSLVFGTRVEEAMVAISELSPDHPLLGPDLLDVHLDYDLAEGEATSGAELLQLMVDSMAQQMHWIQWRRFFTFTSAFPSLDRSWTARLVCGRWLMPGLLASHLGLAPEGRQAKEGRGEPACDAKNTLEKALGMLKDRELQFVGRHIASAIAPLHEWYDASVRAWDDGPSAVGEWCARRAAGDSWLEVIRKMLSCLVQDKILRRCGVSAAYSGEGGGASCLSEMAIGRGPFNAEHLVSSEGAAEDAVLNRSASLVSHVINQVAALAWAHAPFTACLPELFAAVLHPEAAQADGALAKCKTLWERAAGIEAAGAAASDFARDLHWSGADPLVQECLALCVQQDWARSHAVKQMAATLWSGLVDTKRVLEDVLAALKHTSGRSNNLQMSRPRAFFEASVSKRLFPTGSGSPGASPPQSLGLVFNDWKRRLPMPAAGVRSAIFTTPPGHKVKDLDVKAARGGGESCHPLEAGRHCGNRPFGGCWLVPLVRLSD